jgi:hypothetical protein
MHFREILIESRGHSVPGSTTQPEDSAAARGRPPEATTGQGLLVKPGLFQLAGRSVPPDGGECCLHPQV